MGSNPTLDPKRYRDGEPCAHRGCLSHVSHACEGCGRIAGRYPIDPATIRATAQRVVDEWAMHYPTQGWSTWNAPGRDRFIALVSAGVALAAQSHATALADAEREAARKAWGEARDFEQSNKYQVRSLNEWNKERDRYLASEHPAHAPREVVKCALCRQPGADLSTGTHLTRDECIEALGKAFATTEGAR